MAIDQQQQLGRAKNAILNFFERRLSVPKIYLDAKWNNDQLDVLAIDRDGVGDVHAVLLYDRGDTPLSDLNIENEEIAVSDLLTRFSLIPAQYKYVGAVNAFSPDRLSTPVALQWKTKLDKQGILTSFYDDSFAKDGLGRIGFIAISTPHSDETSVKVEIKPERFRAAIAQLADDYVRNHAADWEIRA